MQSCKNDEQEEDCELDAFGDASRRSGKAAAFNTAEREEQTDASVMFLCSLFERAGQVGIAA